MIRNNLIKIQQKWQGKNNMVSACENYAEYKEYNKNEVVKRIRIYFKYIYRNKKAAMKIEKASMDINGVYFIQANPITGNLLILFDSSITDEHTIKMQLYRKTTKRNKTNIIKPKDYTTHSCLKPVPNQMKEIPSKDYHAYKTNEIETLFSVNKTYGLSDSQINYRIKKIGYNVITEEKRKSLFRRFLENLNDFSTKILVGAGLFSTFLGQFIEGIAVLGIAGLETILSTIQQHRADESMYSLKKMMITNACVIRNGRKTTIDAKYLVPGDIIILEPGSRVPADARLIECCDLNTSEAMLTGESALVYKNIKSCKKSTLLAEQKNMIFMGTTILSGRGKAIVVATGKHTQLGKIADMLQNIKKEPAPIQTKIKTFTTKLLKLSLLACFGLSAVRFVQGASCVSVIIFGISFAIGAIPESLPALVTASMSRSIQKMAQKNAIVRKLPAVETLGSANVICCDKTGTLTMNEMTVKEIYVNNSTYKISGQGYNPHGNIQLKSGINNLKDGLTKLLTAGVLCNNSSLTNYENQWSVEGDPTEGALLVSAYKHNLNIENIMESNHRISEIPFDSSRGYMTVLVQNEEQLYACSKGSLSKIMNQCTSIYDNGKNRLFTSTDCETIKEIAKKMGQKALRVLAFAYKEINNEKENIDSNFTFLGLVGMEDPPREEVKDCIKKCHQAGIKVVMITGDNKNTAAAIGRNIGLLTDGIILTGSEIESMSEDTLYQTINKVQIFARTSPQQKHKIVTAFKRAGNVVAMTGDGVNDALAMKEADIGIAMGAYGSDVARDTADMILTDDNFCTIVSAIEEGRNVTRNIKNSMKYILTGCLSEMLVLGAATILTGLPPLASIQILLLDVIAETILGASLTYENASKNIMKYPPNSKEEDILDKPLKKQVLRKGIISGLASFTIFYASLLTGAGVNKARTLAFTSIILSHILNLYMCKINKNMPNKYMNLAAGTCVLLLMGILYLPLLRMVFLTTPLLLKDLLPVIGITAITTI